MPMQAPCSPQTPGCQRAQAMSMQVPMQLSSVPPPGCANNPSVAGCRPVNPCQVNPTSPGCPRAEIGKEKRDSKDKKETKDEKPAKPAPVQPAQVSPLVPDPGCMTNPMTPGCNQYPG